ncbi:hypothetical protein [Nocardioides pantholopis]|uniref:hypothetical protein n=1 Tax=Nocardioides pantholopis TaxID=2483798 RepID=UPI000FD93228|nr:hypothetical protein [Nocardioides pantholopis]
MRPLLPALLLSLVCLTAGCGGDGAGTADPTDSTSSSSASATPSGAAPADPGTDPSAEDLPSSELSELASLAEEQATKPPVISEAVLGADISWPQCPVGMGIPLRPTQGMPMPIPAAEYVIIGLTNGPGFTPNPCLADQVAWVRERGLLVAAYAVVSYPRPAQLRRYGAKGPYDGSTRLGALRNAGYQQARYSRGVMETAGLPSPSLWIDVEPVTAPYAWSGDLRANAAVVRGAARGWSEAGLRIGVYSTPHLWSTVVGDLRLGLPEWRAAGETSRKEALERCGDEWSIQGGEAVLAQWVERRRDQNVTCPDVEDLAGWFHQF